jgi:hypothetical protein
MVMAGAALLAVTLRVREGDALDVGGGHGLDRRDLAVGDRRHWC